MRTTGASGWVGYATGTNILNPLAGYAVNFGDATAPKTVDVTGEVNNGNLSSRCLTTIVPTLKDLTWSAIPILHRLTGMLPQDGPGQTLITRFIISGPAPLINTEEHTAAM